jgi:hypothetical protein
MKRLARHLFTLSAAVSLLLCVVLCLLWIWSLLVAEDLMRQAPYREWRYTSSGGRLNYVEVSWGGSVGIAGSDRPWHRGQRGVRSAPRFGFERFDELKVSPGKFGQMSFDRWSGWSIPYWPFAASAAVLPTMWRIRQLRRAHWRGHGHCRRCGYDLRASRERCPECGTPAKAKTVSR